MSAPAPSLFRAVIFDDNADDRAYLRFLLLRHPSIRVLGETSTFKDALELVNRERPEVLFLETEIAGEPVFDRFALIPPSVQLVFVTAKDSNARQAFDSDALDFLVKPLDADRLAETVRRMLRIEWRRPAERIAPDAKMLIPFERGRRGISIDEVTMIQAFGNYTRLVLEDGKSEIAFRSLVKWAGILPSPPFLQIRRNTIVHSGKIEGLDVQGSGSVIKLRAVEELLPVSRRCLAEVRKVLFPESPEAETVHPHENGRSSTISGNLSLGDA